MGEDLSTEYRAWITLILRVAVGVIGRPVTAMVALDLNGIEGNERALVRGR